MNPRHTAPKQKTKVKNTDAPASVIIFGKHPILEKLANSPKSIEKIVIKDTLDLELAAEIKRLAAKSHIQYTFVPESRLNTLAEGQNHQGLLAYVAPIVYLELKEWLESIADVENPCVLLLDELEDPHNVGAIIRTAVAAGVSGIIMPKHRQAPITGAAYKSAAGLMEKIPIIQVTNVNEAVRTLKDNKFWIIGLDQRGADNYWKQDLDMPICFIIGSESSGMRQKTGELCDFITSIPMDNGAESLNASVSAALVMYEWKRRRSN
jgi:23S rRNA (guanosine2251-2'-O)-methyltransferase